MRVTSYETSRKLSKIIRDFTPLVAYYKRAKTGEVILEIATSLQQLYTERGTFKYVCPAYDLETLLSHIPTHVECTHNPLTIRLGAEDYPNMVLYPGVSDCICNEDPLVGVQGRDESLAECVGRFILDLKKRKLL